MFALKVLRNTSNDKIQLLESDYFWALIGEKIFPLTGLFLEKGWEDVLSRHSLSPSLCGQN